MQTHRTILALLLIACSALARPDTPTEKAPEADISSVEKVDVTPIEDNGEGFVEGENEPIEDFTTIVPPDSGLDPDNATTPDSSNTTTTLPPPTTSTQNTSSSSTTSTTTTTTTEAPTTNTTMTTTTTVTSTSVTPNITTPVTPVDPDAGKSGGFDGWSFFGGIVLALVGVAISFLSVKYWKIRRAQTSGGNYNRF